jgi:hypothetical protein
MAIINKFVVTFISINVTDDGDDFGEGEIYYNFNIDGESIAAITQYNSLGVDSGESIELNFMTGSYPKKELIKKQNQSFTISGTVGDYDDAATGDSDIAGTFTHEYLGRNGWWDGANVNSTKLVKQRLNQDGMDVTVNYKIDYISSVDDEPPVVLGPEPIAERNIADGGVILYQGEGFNSIITASDRLDLISPKQFLRIGDYDLPVDFRTLGGETLGGRTTPAFVIPGIPPKTVSSIRVGTLIQVTLYDRMISERNLGTSTILSQNISKLSDIPYPAPVTG